MGLEKKSRPIYVILGKGAKDFQVNEKNWSNHPSLSYERFFFFFLNIVWVKYEMVYCWNLECLKKEAPENCCISHED